MRTTTWVLCFTIALLGTGIAAVWLGGPDPVRDRKDSVDARPKATSEPPALLEQPVDEDHPATEARAPASSLRGESDELDVPARKHKRATKTPSEIRGPEEYQDDPEVNPEGLVLTTEARSELRALLAPSVQKAGRLSAAIVTRLEFVAEARIAEARVPRQPLATQVSAAPSGVRRLKVVRPDGLYVVDVASGEDPELDAAQLALHELVREAEALATEYFANLPR